jgi:hypothetical protein
MLVLNRLNREYTLINVLKVLASIISICNLHVTFLSKITPRYFTLYTDGMFRPFNVRWDSAIHGCGVHGLCPVVISETKFAA